MCCIGPVCFPLWQLLPVLLALLHQKGYLQWFRKEWVTLTWYRIQFQRIVSIRSKVEPTLLTESVQEPCDGCPCNTTKEE